MPTKPSDVLSVRWSDREEDFVIRYPRRPDGHLAYGIFCADRMRSNPGWKNRLGESPWDFDPSFVKELEARGYDLTTLQFSVRLKKQEEAP